MVCPAGIYGNSAHHIGRSVGSASSRAAGVWTEWMLRNVTEKGFSPYVGEGTSVFRAIHVDDVVRLIMLVFDKGLDLRKGYKREDVNRRYYIAADQEL